ncbi:hypothetical protein [Pedobacter mendelii]|uniref:DUF4926 domain-containing protein n=1 Tax=Pedobacter mendelii TaxID=1908240 RepID=A0ABQ2BEX4_9SPHI|nr:hypothetical protein [Pedobacter mendelii]GGI24479.1 hypothetical protein GCM10008119_12860 [Pedobacter mendelii]
MLINNDETTIKLDSLQVGDFIENKSGSKGVIEQINILKTPQATEYYFQLFDGKGIVFILKEKSVSK